MNQSHPVLTLSLLEPTRPWHFSGPSALQAILNFDLSDYQDILDNPEAYDPAAAAASAATGAAGASSAGAAAAAAAAAAHCADASAVAAAALGGQFLAAAAGLPLGVLPGGGMFLPMVAEAASQMWGFAGMPAVVFAPQYQPSPLGAAAHQPSPLGPFHFQLPLLGAQTGMPSTAASHQPNSLSTASSIGAFSPAGAPSTAGGTAAEPAGPLLCLPAIRTRVAATAAAAGGAADVGTTDGTAATAGTPVTAGSADVDLAGFLLSPLAASLLSPLALAGTPGSGEGAH